MWWFVAVPVGASAAILYSLAFPAGNSGPFLLGGLVWLLIALVWLVRLVVSRNRWLLATPLVALVTAGLAYGDVPLKAAFAAAEGGLARQVAGGEPGWAGIYEVDGVRRGEGTDLTFLPLADGGGAFYAEAGFLHAPSGIPDGAPDLEYVRLLHLDGPWYWYDVPESEL